MSTILKGKPKKPLARGQLTADSWQASLPLLDDDDVIRRDSFQKLRSCHPKFVTAKVQTMPKKGQVPSKGKGQVPRCQEHKAKDNHNRM